MSETQALLDVVGHRASGDVCSLSNGKQIVWNGHLCEGANLTPQHNENFCLWTRCGTLDVPFNQAYEGDEQDVVCLQCLAISKATGGEG